jgi:hypothetical protein
MVLLFSTTKDDNEHKKTLHKSSTKKIQQSARC